ncbi:glycosyltransferase family 1 protein [Paenibacillus sp. FSL R7-0128]|uniref:glycosyltransferase family 1 protein n=1 Tax=Paenibacillus sp. FSL R7-0128 TaxID=2954529 RepID=UPI0030F87FAE
MNVHNSPVRILHVFGIMNCGGAETFIMNVYRNIDREKIQFDFIVHSEDKGYYDDEIEALGGTIYSIPKFKGKNIREYIKSWNVFFDTYKDYQIIHSHIRSTASVFLSMAKKRGIITIIHSHNTSSGKGIIATIKNLLQLPLRKISHYRFACSIDAGEWLYGKKKFEVMNNAIDAKKFTFDQSTRDRYRKELELVDKFVVGHIGRFHEQKNHEFLLDMFKSLNTKHPNTVLLLIGDGDLRYTIERKIIKLGLQNSVVLLGVRSDIPQLLQAIDVFAFPSIYEGLGIVVIEAQAAGLPCVISDVVPSEVGITDLVKFISLKENPEYWAKEVITSRDSNIRKSTFEKIKKANYDVKDQVKLLEDFYLKISIE